MQIMMIRTQRPIKLTAYKFADVSLTLFTRVSSPNFLMNEIASKTTLHKFIIFVVISDFEYHIFVFCTSEKSL